MAKVLIAGGSGFIGKRLTALLLRSGHEVAWLSRKAISNNQVVVFQWDTAKQWVDEKAIQWADQLVILSGEGIAEKRWTAARKEAIIQSRVKGIDILYSAMNSVPHHIQSIVTASAVGFYGSRGNETLTETSAPGEGFLSTSTQAWEAASHKLQEPGIEVTLLRIGLVLGREAGLIKEMDRVLRFGIRPILGNGRQWYPWIHADDLCSIIAFSLERKLNGTYNAVAPHPVSQAQLLRAMATASGRFTLPAPAPAFVLQLMLGEMSNAVLASQNVSAQKLQDAGFSFAYPKLDAALQQLYAKK